VDIGIEGLEGSLPPGGLGDVVEGGLDPLGSLVFGDVALEDQDPRHGPLLVPEGDLVRQGPEELPRRGLVALQEAIQGASRAEHLPVLVEKPSPLLGEELFHGEPLGRSRHLAGEALDVGVGPEHVVVSVLQGDGKGGLFEDEAKALLLKKIQQSLPVPVVIRSTLRHVPIPLSPIGGAFLSF